MKTIYVIQIPAKSNHLYENKVGTSFKDKKNNKFKTILKFA